MSRHSFPNWLKLALAVMTIASAGSLLLSLPVTSSRGVDSIVTAPGKDLEAAKGALAVTFSTSLSRAARRKPMKKHWSVIAH